MRRNLFLLIVVVFTAFSAYSQTSDERLSQLLSNQDFFKLKEELPQLKKDASPSLYLFARAYVNSYLGNPDAANQDIQQLLSQYHSWLGAEHQLTFAVLMAENFAKQQKYTEAAAIYGQVINQIGTVVTTETLKSYQSQYYLYNSLKDAPVMEISNIEDTTGIPLKIDSLGFITIPVNLNSSTTMDFLVDFGAGYCMMEEQEATKLGVEIMADSINVLGGAGTYVNAKLGIAKELVMGKIKLQNVAFIVFPNKLIDAIPGYEIKGVIGLPVLQALKSIIISEHSLTVQPTHLKSGYEQNMMIANHAVFVKVIEPKDTLFMQFDSGSNESMLTQRYLAKESTDKSSLSPITKRQGSISGTKSLTGFIKDDFSCTIGSKTMRFPIFIVNDDMQTLLPVDGIIGLDVMRKNKETIIDFENRYIDFK